MCLGMILVYMSVRSFRNTDSVAAGPGGFVGTPVDVCVLKSFFN